MSFFLFFWLHWVFVAVHGLSLVAASGGYSSWRCAGFSCCRAWALGVWASVVAARGPQSVQVSVVAVCGLSSCGAQAQQLWLAGSRAEAQQLWHTGLVALWHVGSSWTRDQTRVPCIGRRILNHCATREVPQRCLLKLH